VVTVSEKQTPEQTPEHTHRRKFSTGFDRFSGLYLGALFIIVFGIWVPSEFLTTSTLHSVAAQQAVTGMIGLAVLIPLAAGLYDLSVGATANVSGILTIVLMNNHHWAVAPAIIAGILIAVAIGLTNSFIVVKLGVNSFIATLGMGSILAALQVIISSNSQPIPPTSTAWNNLTQTTVAGFQIVVLYLIILAFLLWWLTAHTPVGRYLYAIGGNNEAARLSGVRIERYTTFALVMSATIAGFAGVMFSSLNGPSLDFGSTLLLPAFAAAFLGSTQLIERHVQRRGADHRGGPVHPAVTVRALGADQSEAAWRLRRISRRSRTARYRCGRGSGHVQRPGRLRSGQTQLKYLAYPDARRRAIRRHRSTNP